MLDLNKLLPPFNPWWRKTRKPFQNLPTFRRPIFDELRQDIRTLTQIISVIGPRRIGKTTLLLQLIADLIESGVDPRRIVYYSMDDPALILNTPEEINGFIEGAMRRTESTEGTWYFFLDEIQRLAGWELYLKKYYDLKYPVRFIVSGSASSPIFKKSRESLLGRIKNYHLLPFSFREFALYRAQETPAILQEMEAIYRQGARILERFERPKRLTRNELVFPRPSKKLQARLDGWLAEFFIEGGFPEVWSMPTLIQKQEYLFENQVRKVIDEDLVLAVELRKPELLKRFYLSLLAMPGAETNIQAIAKETGIHSAQIEKYLPLFETTDLLFHVSKFRSGSLTVRKGNMKFYVCDLALRNAVLRIAPEELRADDRTLGRYAENLIYLTLQQWRGPRQVDFFRERNEEIDFILHYGAAQYLAIEVKYQNSISGQDGRLLRKFSREYMAQPIMITKAWEHFGIAPGTLESEGENAPILYLPLPFFLALFG